MAPPEVLRLMLARLEGSASAVALEVDARAQQLPLVVRREAALGAARGLVESGERRLGALLEALAVTTIAEADWRAIDPEARHAPRHRRARRTCRAPG